MTLSKIFSFSAVRTQPLGCGDAVHARLAYTFTFKFLSFCSFNF